MKNTDKLILLGIILVLIIGVICSVHFLPLYVSILNLLSFIIGGVMGIALSYLYRKYFKQNK